jgi:threonyl-tRNA synthetase
MGMLDSYWVSLSVRDDEDKSKYLWSDEVWAKAEWALEEAAIANGLPYKRMPWEAAFYGPKLDFMFKDCIWREWQLATIQCDFNLPERFNLSFTNEEWNPERPVVIHRAVSGSLERFIWIIIEHFAGLFPTWLSPRQVIIVPVADKFDDYAKALNQKLKELDIRSTVDYSTDSLNKKVRNAETSKYNYVLIVWEQEVADNTVSVRNVKTKEQTTEKVDDFIASLVEEIKTRRL